MCLVPVRLSSDLDGTRVDGELARIWGRLEVLPELQLGDGSNHFIITAVVDKCRQVDTAAWIRAHERPLCNNAAVAHQHAVDENSLAFSVLVDLVRLGHLEASVLEDNALDDHASILD